MQLMPGGVAACTASSNSDLWRSASSVSSSYALSKWSSIARLLRPLMKIMSVMPAAAASSTANWISGLSTIGSISFGLALVTGRKRLPRPATGKTALVILPDAMEHSPELFFVDHRHSQLAGAVELAARIVAGDDIARLLRNAARDFPALLLDQLFRILARERRQRSGQDERQAGELASGFPLRRSFRPLYPGRAQLGNHLAVVRFREELPEALRQHRPDLGNLEQRRLVRGEQRVELAEMAREVLRGRLADVPDAQREDEPRQRRFPALGARSDDVGGGFLRHPFELGDCRHAELVQVCRRAHDFGVDQLIDQLVAEALDVHGATAGRMQLRLLHLRGADQPARAARNRLIGK